MTNTDVVNSTLRAGEDNDCAVVAHAHVTGTSYESAHALLKSLGRRNRCGTRLSISDKALALSTASFVQVAGDTGINNLGLFTQRGTESVTRVLRRLPKVGRYWICAGGHAFAYVDGVLLDNLHQSRTRAKVRRCYKVTLKSEAKPAPTPNTEHRTPNTELSQTDINGMWQRLLAIEAKL